MATLTVEQWLESLNLGEYASVFIDEGYDDMNVVLEMTEDDLTDLQNVKKGHIKKILLNIQNLRDSGVTFNSGTTAKKTTSNKPSGVQGIATNKNGGKQPISNPSSTSSKSKFENNSQTTQNKAVPKPAVKTTHKESAPAAKKLPSLPKPSAKRDPAPEQDGPQPLKERTMSSGGLKNKAAMFEQGEKFLQENSQLASQQQEAPQKDKPSPKKMNAAKISFLQETPGKPESEPPTRGKVANDYSQLFGTIRPNNSKVVDEMDAEDYDSTLATVVNTPSKLMRALGDYKAESTVELNFKEGDIVCVLEEHASGWWKGYMQNRPNVEGLFPSNYFEEVSEEDLKKKPMKKQSSNEIVTLNFGGSEDSPVPGAEPRRRPVDEDKPAAKKPVTEPTSSKENLAKKAESSEKNPRKTVSTENLAVKKSVPAKATESSEKKPVDEAKPAPKPSSSSSIKDRAKLLQQHQGSESSSTPEESSNHSSSTTSTSTNTSTSSEPEQEVPKPKKMFGVAVMPGLSVKQTKPTPKSEAAPSEASMEPSKVSQTSDTSPEPSVASKTSGPSKAPSESSQGSSEETTTKPLALSPTPPAKPLPVPVKRNKSEN